MNAQRKLGIFFLDFSESNSIKTKTGDKSSPEDLSPSKNSN